MTVFREYPGLPGVHFTDAPLNRLNGVLDRITKTVNALMQGRINARGDVTLGSGTTTTIANTLVTPTSSVLLTPTSSKARTVQWHMVSTATVAQTSFRVAHPSGSSGATFVYHIFG